MCPTYKTSSKALLLCCRRHRLERELQREELSEEERQHSLAALEQRERDFTRLQRQRLSAADFEPLTIIGRGAFGEVNTSVVAVRVPLPDTALHLLGGFTPDLSPGPSTAWLNPCTAQ